jgi:hypothetical protein
MVQKAEAVILGDLELDKVTHLYVEESRKLALHRWPGGDGDLVQDLGAAAAVIRLAGVTFGTDSGTLLEKLRQAMQTGEPLDFAASAAVASNIEQVLVSRLVVEQPPGRMEYYEYSLELLRYVPPPPPQNAGFDTGALAGIAGDLSAAAAESMGDFAATLGTAAEALGALEQAADLIADAMEVLEAVEGMAEIAKLMEALGKVASAASE